MYSNRRNKFILETLNKILIAPQDRDFKSDRLTQILEENARKMTALII